MTDTKLLKAKLVEHGLRQEDAAKMLGITLVAFSNKILNKTPFKQTEIDTLIYKLNLTVPEMVRIFFSKNVN